MYAAYQSEGAAYYVVELDGKVLGCGGFASLAGGDHLTCELRKMYFKPELRGLGDRVEIAVKEKHLDEALGTILGAGGSVLSVTPRRSGSRWPWAMCWRTRMWTRQSCSYLPKG